MIRFLLPVIILGITTCFNMLYPKNIFSENPPMERAPFAVIELFTSEGCSSCPPADQLLSRITEESRQKNQRIFTLSFHVDYWNYLGWADPYSTTQNSQRQRRYTRLLAEEATYTPQMIINGKHSFPGYRADQAEKTIRESLTELPTLDLRIKLRPDATEKLIIEYVLDALPENCLIQIAVVEEKLSQNITRGENAGKTLTHQNVVRYFLSTTLNEQEGTLTLDTLPNNLFKTHLIVFIQNEQTGAILAADSMPLH